MLMMAKGKFHPWMALALVIFAGAATLVFVLRQPEAEGGPAVEAAVHAAPAPTSPEPARTTAPVNLTTLDGISADEIDRFRKNMRRTLLHSRYEWISSPAARELFVTGRMREAVEQSERELVTRTAAGDRDAAAWLFDVWHGCNDPDFLDAQNATAEDGPMMRSKLQAVATRLGPATHAKALATIDVSAGQAEIFAAICQQPVPIDMPELEEKVRRAAADGHTPSLKALAAVAAWNRDEARRERYLLSASLLGDVQGQWRLAAIYRGRLASSSSSKDRGKMRFWLEQAYDKLPAAAFELGQCLLADCDGQPANPDRARRLIASAAQQGDAQAMDFMIQGTDGIDSGDRFARYAWLEFQTRLADEGCSPDQFMALVVFNDRRARTRNAFYPNERAQADQRGEELYEQYGAGARAALGCN